MTLILGIDPGLATGIALYDMKTCTLLRVLETPQGIHGFKKPFLNIMQDLRDEPYVVACEGFTLRSSNKFTADLHGVEIIGWLKGEEHCFVYPEPSQHMTVTRLRKNKDDYAKSPVTHMMKAARFPIGKGHTRMAGSVGVWYAAMKLKHIPTLETLKAKDTK